jgi:hypothetical protein
MESIDKATHGTVSKPSGCNESERSGDLEKMWSETGRAQLKSYRATFQSFVSSYRLSIPTK